MSKMSKVNRKALAECGPERLINALSISGLIGCGKLCSRHVLQHDAEIILRAHPLCQVVERFLGPNRSAVIAQQKGKGWWVGVTSQKLRIEESEDRLAQICYWENA